MMKKYILFAVVLGLLISCTKEFEEVKVEYRIAGLSDAYTVWYMDAEANTVKEVVDQDSPGDVWIKSFTMRQGDIVYLSLKYEEDDPPNDKFRVMITMDGKMFHYADEYDKYAMINGDEVYYVKRSGTVPY